MSLSSFAPSTFFDRTSSVLKGSSTAYHRSTSYPNGVYPTTPPPPRTRRPDCLQPSLHWWPPQSRGD